MKRYSVILLAALILSLFPKTTFAAEFSSSYTANYTVNPDGTAQVVQNIQVTNLVPEYYVSKYTIDLGVQKIKDLKAIEKNKELKASAAQSASNSAIVVEFNDKTIGKGSTKRFTVTYTAENFVQKSGNLQTLNIPKVSGTGITKYDLTVKIPNSLGVVSSITPEPLEEKSDLESTTITFSTKQVTSSSIALILGEKQYYTLGLTYHLKNPQSKSVYTEVAFPMNTPYQKILFENITPKPQSISVDEDGNYIGRYNLAPKQELDVQFTGKAIIYKDRQREDKKITDQQKTIYTQKQTYWETDNEHIATLAAQLKTPEKIYQYVIDTLRYDTSKLGSEEFIRLGAASVLQNPTQSVCMEFTDLFITLARAAGIPAREINGYAYTNDPVTRPLSLSQDLLHAWPEYWDEEKGWVQVDPTWQNTTRGIDYFNSFDLNHIAFVRKGYSSEYPYPAGSYKGKDPNTRDVLVSFSDHPPEMKEQFQLKTNANKTFITGSVKDTYYTVENKGNTGLEKTATIVDQETGKELSQDLIIPPMTTSKFMLIKKDDTTGLNKENNLVVTIDDQSASTQVLILPWYQYSPFYFAIGYMIGLPALCIILYKALHKRSMQRRKLSV